MGVEVKVKLEDPSLFRQPCYIDGAWVDAVEGASLEVTNPAKGEVIGTVPALGTAETRRAIETADDTEFGLAACFYARDMGRIWRVAEGLKSGIIGQIGVYVKGIFA